MTGESSFSVRAGKGLFSLIFLAVSETREELALTSSLLLSSRTAGVYAAQRQRGIVIFFTQV
ncbi:hypothetical protein CSUI_003816 [Cystoisospora suis]|uniref:Uncharacterized protein n=1 Tax=Cystoisospora suis TaxID=483139 RepID=A0A2C6L132_9APIC|nr:hypothetical protein CSUI_003816 [Cystoisospora suis]